MIFKSTVGSDINNDTAITKRLEPNNDNVIMSQKKGAENERIYHSS
jgi:hypothetical protein